jgi:phasin family protein
MANTTSERITKASADDIAKNAQVAEKIVKDDIETLAESGIASRTAVQELTKAYQDLATKNAKNLSEAIHELSSVKNPAEFFELQQRLMKEGVEAAVSDSRHIAHLTTAVFTAAFEPVKRQIETMQKTATH